MSKETQSNHPQEVKKPGTWSKFLDSFGVGSRWEKEAAYLEQQEKIASDSNTSQEQQREAQINMEQAVDHFTVEAEQEMRVELAEEEESIEQVTRQHKADIQDDPALQQSVDDVKKEMSVLGKIVETIKRPFRKKTEETSIPYSTKGRQAEDDWWSSAVDEIKAEQLGYAYSTADTDDSAHRNDVQRYVDHDVAYGVGTESAPTHHPDGRPMTAEDQDAWRVAREEQLAKNEQDAEQAAEARIAEIQAMSPEERQALVDKGALEEIDSLDDNKRGLFINFLGNSKSPIKRVLMKFASFVTAGALLFGAATRERGRIEETDDTTSTEVIRGTETVKIPDKVVVEPVSVDISGDYSREYQRDFGVRRGVEVPDIDDEATAIENALYATSPDQRISVTITGYASFEGADGPRADERDNLSLSQKRAEAAQEAIIAELLDSGWSEKDLERIDFVVEAGGERFQYHDADGTLQTFASEGEALDYLQDACNLGSHGEVWRLIGAYNDGRVTDQSQIDVLQDVLDANRVHTANIAYSTVEKVTAAEGSVQEVPTKEVVETVEEGEKQLVVDSEMPVISRKKLLNKETRSPQKNDKKPVDIVDPVVPPPEPPPKPPTTDEETYQFTGQSSAELQTMKTSLVRKGNKLRVKRDLEKRRPAQATKDTGGAPVRLDDTGDAIPAPRRAGAGKKEVRSAQGRNDKNPTSVAAMRRELGRDAKKEKDDIMYQSFGGGYDQERELTRHFDAESDDEDDLYNDSYDTPQEMSEAEALAAYGIELPETDEQKGARYMEDTTEENPRSQAAE